MRILDLAETTRPRLRTLDRSATARSAAAALSAPGAGLVVISAGGEAVGVVSKSDLVRHLARAGAADAGAAGLMTRTVFSCRPEEDLRAVWHRMTAAGLQNVPVLGDNARPLGVLDVRDAMRAILATEEMEERALENYIAGVGYR